MMSKKKTTIMNMGSSLMMMELQRMRKMVDTRKNRLGHLRKTQMKTMTMRMVVGFTYQLH